MIVIPLGFPTHKVQTFNQWFAHQGKHIRDDYAYILKMYGNDCHSYLDIYDESTELMFLITFGEEKLEKIQPKYVRFTNYLEYKRFKQNHPSATLVAWPYRENDNFYIVKIGE